MVLPPVCSESLSELPQASLVSQAVEAGLQERAEQALQESVEVSTSISEHFASLSDPRESGRVDHKLLDIVTITVCAVICGANNWVEVEVFGQSCHAWLSQFLELPGGIPSHDTFGRVFGLISGEAFQRSFASWMQSMFEHSDGQMIAIDGKRLRRSHDKKSNKAAIHMVSAWAQENRVVLGQVKTASKSNEITAIPKLLELLDIKGCIVTIDALGCQRAIAGKIKAGGGDYVLALKGNQSQLHTDVVEYFEYAQRRQFQSILSDYHETIDKAHGRVEIRRYRTIAQLDWLEEKSKWAGLRPYAPT